MPRFKPWKSWLVRFAALIFVPGVLGSMAFVIFALRTKCEGFSCGYVGLIWIFWAGAVFLPVTLLGLCIRNAGALPAWGHRIVRLAFRAHLVLAGGLLVIWIHDRLTS